MYESLMSLFPNATQSLKVNDTNLVPSYDPYGGSVPSSPMPGLGGKGMGFDPNITGQVRPPGSLTDKELKKLIDQYWRQKNLENALMQQNASTNFGENGMSAYQQFKPIGLDSLMAMVKGG